MMRRVACLALLLCAFAGWSDTGAFAPVEESIAAVEKEITPERRAALDAGEILRVEVAGEEEGDDQRASGIVMLVINRPAEEAFARIRDVSDQHEYMPRVESIVTYGDSDNPQGQKQTLKVAMRTVVYHILVQRDDEKNFLTWHLDASQENDIAATTGYWYFMPWGEGKCLAVYHVFADTGMRVPKWLANWLMNRDMPGVAENLKKRVESDGKWEK